MVPDLLDREGAGEKWFKRVLGRAAECGPVFCCMMLLNKIALSDNLVATLSRISENKFLTTY